jgi:hypothetical protein
MRFPYDAREAQSVGLDRIGILPSLRTPPSVLFRGVLKFFAVAVAAAAVGIGLGVGLSKLTGDNASSPALPAATTSAPTSSTTTSETTSTATETTATSAAPTRTITTTTAPTLSRAPAQSSGGALRIDVISTVVHRVTNDPDQRASVSVHVRVTNGGSRVVKPNPPELLVGQTALKISPDGSAKDAAPLLAALAQGAIADGRLRFDSTGTASAQLTTPGRVRLRVAGKLIVVTPELGRPVSG